MRTRGLQWVELKAQWSSKNDEDASTVPELTNHLKEIIKVEKARREAGELPTHAPAPIMKRKTYHYKQLGSPTAHVAAWVTVTPTVTVLLLRLHFGYLHSHSFRRQSLLVSAWSCLLTRAASSSRARARTPRGSR